MMARLYKTSSTDGAEILLDKLDVANNLWSRAKGLLGRNELASNEALWINPCNNIHTFFMNFKIDCIFVDQKMQVKYLAKNVRPYRFVGPFWKAHSVFETSNGFIDLKKIEIGDQLYVVD